MAAEPVPQDRRGALSYPGLRTQPDQGHGAPGRVRRVLQRFLRAQFGRPSGLWGMIVGRIMARTTSNSERIRWTIALLDIRPTDRVLEVGFGPGVGVELASRRASAGFVLGIDHSEVMVQQASARNARAIQTGLVALQRGSVTDLPSFDHPFDKVFTVNSLHFWPDPVMCLAELRRSLKPGGMIAVTLQPRSRNATDETARAIGEEVTVNLERAGFVRCRLEMRPMAPVAAACALGVNPE